MSAPIFTEHFASLAPAYDVVLCDVWGVVHNGVAATPQAAEALARFRAGGGTVVLITNAPRPSAYVRRQLDRFGVVPEAYDAVISSGDVTREVVRARRGQALFHIGPERDRPIFADLEVRFAPAESADYVVCSGLFDDDHETPDDYDPLIARMRARSLFMVCANPDVVVERGEELLYCAGAIADRYRAHGGEVLYAGKPYRPISEGALDKASARRGAKVPLARVLAIGDSVRTDLTGAAALGVDFMFVTSGIHAQELGAREDPDPAVLADLLGEARLAPRAVMRRLAW